MGKPYEVEKPRTRCAVLVPVIKNERGSARSGSVATDDAVADGWMRTPEAQLEEASGLALAIDLDIVLTDISQINQIRPATLYGGGKVEEIHDALHAAEVTLTIVDHPLTPVQQRNLERAWETKVLDRTGIILEIFGARAQTKEGRLQVDLAALNYQRGRLVRSWTHLERQRGGGGFLGGPGETQIEADRRALQTKIERLEKQLDQVRRTRSLHRQQRKKQEIPVIAFVGYTNAGKSTLFNKITQADVMAKDLLFATLDPTLRRISLPAGTDTILSDTVGFISNLPTDLVAAFRATLEEVTEADIIVHVRDIAHEDSRAQADDVRRVLLEMGIDVDNTEALKEEGRVYLEVWNKVDMLSVDERQYHENVAAKDTGYPVVMTSALTGEGGDQLLSLFENKLTEGGLTRIIRLAGRDLSQLHIYYEYGTVLKRQDGETGEVELTVRSDRWSKINAMIMR